MDLSFFDEPGRLAKAMGFTLADNGLCFDGVLAPRKQCLPRTMISTGPRVGLRHAAERPWCFWVTDDPTVSRYVPAKPRKASEGDSRGR